MKLSTARFVFALSCDKFVFVDTAGGLYMKYQKCETFVDKSAARVGVKFWLFQPPRHRIVEFDF
jgi:hypothetical protein